LLAGRTRRKLIVVKVLAKLASAFLLVWLLASPAMACLLPIAQLSPEEKACCRKMAGNCDGMGHNASHSCCQKVQTHNPSFVVAKNLSTSVHRFSATPLNFAHAIHTISAGISASSMSAEYGYSPGHSPPTLPEIIAFRI
jgi:hypothetical protein